MSSLLDGAGDLLGEIPEIYDDALKPTVQESGQVVALVPKAINAALVPLRKWIAEREYSLAQTEKLLAEKLKNVPEEKITTPEAYIGVPALQAIAYSMDCDELRDMYANLLASAMNVDLKSGVHPSFAELIKQMSPTDARVFKTIHEATITPALDLYISVEATEESEGGDRHHIYNITWIDDISYKEVVVSIDNLIRLGLIEMPSGIFYTHKANYDVVKATQTFRDFERMLQSRDEGAVKTTEKYIRRTALADAFYEVCVKG